MADRSKPPRRVPANVRLIGLTIALLATALLYRGIAWGELRAWSVFFHGLPAVLAIALALSGPRRTLRGRVMFGVTIAMLLAGTILGEGFICIVIAAPFAYMIAAACTYMFGSDGDRRVYSAIAPLAVALSFLSSLGAPDISTVQSTLATSIGTAEVAAALAAEPDVPPAGSGFLSFGFPQPVAMTGSGVEIGDERRITFSDGGVLTLRVLTSRDSRVVFEAVSDTSMIGDWISWTTAEFSWVGTAAGTSVSLDLSYERHLQPGWYFGPVVAYGVDQAADHLLASLIP